MRDPQVLKSHHGFQQESNRLLIYFWMIWGTPLFWKPILPFCSHFNGNMTINYQNLGHAIFDMVAETVQTVRRKPIPETIAR